jgi:transcriptional regulator
MYIPNAFAQTDAAEITRFLDRHPLATVVGLIEGRIDAQHLPVMRSAEVAPGQRLVSHTARANPIWRLGEARAEVLVIFSGAAAYVSPSFYPTKAEHHKVVPTYNYASVHVRGTLTCSHDKREKLQVVEMLTRRMESGREARWAVSDAPRDYIDRMLDGIVALSVEITSIEAKWKASQNRAPVDRRGVVDGLRAGTNAAADLEAAEIAEQYLDRK